MNSRIIYLIVFLHISIILLSQDCLNTDYFSGSAGWGVCTQMNDVRGTKIFIANPNVLGNNYFRFLGDGTPCSEFGPEGAFDEQINPCSIYSLTCTGLDGKAYYINSSNISYNYIFKTGGTGSSNPLEGHAIVFEIRGPIQTVTGVERPDQLYLGQAATITATMSDALSPGQGVYLRYSTDFFNTSTIVELTGSGTSYSYTIPEQSGNTNVVFYVLTSGTGLILSDENVDLHTINYNDNETEYYSYYTVDAYLANTNGVWSSNATWANGSVPPSGSNIVINANVDLDGDQNTADFAIGNGGFFNIMSNSLTCTNVYIYNGVFNGASGNLICDNFILNSVFNASSGTLTINSGGKIQNSGAFNPDNGKVVFSGSGELSGSITFNDVDIHGGVDFRVYKYGLIKVANINGILSIKNGGFVSTAYSPKFNVNSTLEYASGGEFITSYEWNDKWWIDSDPYKIVASDNTHVRIIGGRVAHDDVIVNSGSSISLEGVDAGLNCNKLIIEAGGIFNALNGILSLYSGLNNSGDFSAGTGKVYFGGTGYVTGMVTLNNVDVVNGDVDFGTSCTVNGKLSIKLQGLVSTHGPAYGPASVLEYMSEYFELGAHTAGQEWEHEPNDVIIKNTALTIPANTSFTMSGTLTLKNGGILNLNDTASSFSCLQLIIESGSQVGLSNSELIIGSGGTFTNDGVLVSGSGKVVFAENGYINGISNCDFNDVEIHGSVDFGFHSTVNGILTIKSGGTVSINPPEFGNNSSILYAVNGAYVSGLELHGGWHNGNVEISENTILTLSQGAGVMGNVAIHTGGEINITDTYLYVEDLNINGTVNLTNGNVGINGNIENNGNFTANNSGIELWGTSDHIIGGNQPIDISYLYNYDPTSVILNDHVIINEELLSDSGKIILNNHDLKLNTGAFITLDNGAYIITNGSGGLIQSIPFSEGTFLYPIGSINEYHPVTIDFTVGPTQGDLKAKFLASSPGISGLPIIQGGIQIDNVSPTGYWELTALNGLTGGLYNIKADASGFTKIDGTTQITDYNNIRLIKRNTGGNWIASGINEDIPIDLGNVMMTDVSGFSDFAIGGTDSALPLTLLKIIAYSNGSDNIVKWTALRERDVKYYHIERCNNLKQNWIEIGAVNSDMSGDYHFKDQNPLSATNFYRLKIEEASGYFIYSNTVLVENSKSSDNFEVFPSFASEIINIVIDQASPAEFIILDQGGNTHFKCISENKNTILKVDIRKFRNGMYFVLKHYPNGKDESIRFIKIK